MPDEAQLAASKVGVDAELEYWRPRYARLGRILEHALLRAALKKSHFENSLVIPLLSSQASSKGRYKVEGVAPVN